MGFNKRGWARWATTNKVVAATPGREFAFNTEQSGTCWRYRFEATDGGTIVTESREAVKQRPLAAKLFTKLALGGVPEHDDEMRDGMRATLGRLKAIAEQ